MHCNCILPRHRAASNNSPPLGPKNWTCHRGCHRGWSDEIAARLYDENCFVCRSSPESLIQLDELIVENLIPEVNPLANAERTSEANAARGTFCTIFNSALSDLLNCQPAEQAICAVPLLLENTERRMEIFTKARWTFQHLAYSHAVNSSKRF